MFRHLEVIQLNYCCHIIESIKLPRHRTQLHWGHKSFFDVLFLETALVTCDLYLVTHSVVSHLFSHEKLRFCSEQGSLIIVFSHSNLCIKNLLVDLNQTCIKKLFLNDMKCHASH